MWRKLSLFLLTVVLLVGFFVGRIYFTQEKELFLLKSLQHDHSFCFETPHEEVFFEREDGGLIHALHFTLDDPRGTILYFHGRGGNLAHPWGVIAHEFLGRGYDVFMMDYRGTGKSRGKLDERTLLSDAQTTYDYLKERLSENKIVIYGCSLGTGIATFVAAQNNPRALILESPYFSLLEQMTQVQGITPAFVLRMLLKYPLKTHDWIKAVACPITLLHSTDDDVIPYDASVKLVSLNKLAKLVTVPDHNHSNIDQSPLYQSELDAILIDEVGDEAAPARLM